MVLKIVEVVVIIVGHVVVVQKVASVVVALFQDCTRDRCGPRDRPYPFPAQTGRAHFGPSLHPLDR